MRSWRFGVRCHFDLSVTRLIRNIRRYVHRTQHNIHNITILILRYFYKSYCHIFNNARCILHLSTESHGMLNVLYFLRNTNAFFPLQRTEPWKISVTVRCGNFTAHAACYRTVKKKGRIRVACRMTAACMSVCVLVCMFVTFTPIVTNFTIWREMWREGHSAELHYINVPSHVRCKMYGVWFWGYLMVSSPACWRRTYTKFTLIFIGLHWIVLWRML